MSIGGDLELNNSTYSIDDANLIGISTSLNYRNRNLFKNAALFTSRARFGFELDIASSGGEDLLYSRDISLLNDLYFPRLVDKDSAFLEIERNNPFLQRSFDDQLLTGFLFRDLTFTHQGKINRNNISFYFSGNFETQFWARL